MSALQELFGSTLIASGGEKKNTSSLDADCIGLYFSAHWCPPCKAFTPELIKVYGEVVKDGKKLEIVFISSDNSEAEFTEYFETMPWLALPYADREQKNKLSKKFKVDGIPSLVFVDKNAKVINTNGRQAVSEDPAGAEFPWPAPTFSDLIGDNFQRNDGTKVTFDEALRGKTLGLYFSAHWCPPCRGFTPKLSAMYKQMMTDGKSDEFEIVFISSDKDESAFEEYHKEMPWLALPFSERKQKAQLSTFFGVSGIPAFIVIDKDGKVLNKNARGAVDADPQGEKFPWKPAAMNDLSTGADGINETASIIVCMDGMEAGARESLKKECGMVAGEFAKAAEKSGDEMEYLFFTTSEAGGLTERIREMTKIGGAKKEAQMILLDCADEGAYYVHEGKSVDSEGMRKFISDFKSGNLTRNQLE